MNILLWVLQGALALLFLSGGAYKVFAFDEVANQPHARWLSRGGWRTLGAIEMVGGVLLVLPAALGRMPGLTPVAAALLALETLFLAGMFARYSRRMVATNPMAWTLVMGLMAAFVAYGRFALEPLA